MGTKNDPGQFDCYAAAMPDEPIFTLLARDPNFLHLVSMWADRRWRDMRCGERPESDREMVMEARELAISGQTWRRENNGAWRLPQNKNLRSDRDLIESIKLLDRLNESGDICFTLGVTDTNLTRLRIKINDQN